MTNKVKLYLGCDDSGSLRAVNAQSLLVSGIRGTGKTEFVRNFIFNLLTYNSKDDVKVELFTTNNRDTKSFDTSKSKLPEFSIESEKELGDYLQDIIWKYEDTIHLLNVSKCSCADEYNANGFDRKILNRVYILDCKDVIIKYNSTEFNNLRKLVKDGWRVGIYIVFIDRDAEFVPETIIKDFKGRIILYSTEEASIKLLGSTMASTQDVFNLKIAIYKDNNPTHSPIYFSIPTVHKNSLRTALDIIETI